MIRDDFAGAGGWEEALKLAGNSQEVIGYDNNIFACDTARIAGHQRECIDVLTVDSKEKITGYVASPPCTSFSVAGTGEGRETLKEYMKNPHVPSDPNLALLLHPFSVIKNQQPEWFVLENVPAVLNYWKYMSTLLDYNTIAIKLYTEQYGVPQTRIRVFLVGSRGIVKRPTITHDRYHALSQKQGILQPPVSMRDVLKFDDSITNQVSFYNKGGGDGGAGNRRSVNLPSLTITSKSFAWENKDGDRQIANTAQAGVLQTFRSDYPWQGRSKDRWLQIGNAVPPVLGASILRNLI